MFRASEIYGREHSGLDASSSGTYGQDHSSQAPEASPSATYGFDHSSPAPEADITKGSGKGASKSWNVDSSFGESTSQSNELNTGSLSQTSPPKHVPPPPCAVDWGAAASGTDGKDTADKGAQASPTTLTLHGAGLSAAGEQIISDACRKVAIDGGFSVPEQVIVQHHSSAHIVFLHHSTAMEFLQKTNGGLWIGGKVFHVKPTRGQQRVETCAQPQQEVRNIESPTDTLVIRGIGDMTTRQLTEAFANLTPRLKRVKVHTDKAGKSKGLGWVTFEEIEEADLVLQRLKKEGCMLSGRRVSVKFHEPSTIEDMVELEARKKRSLESIEASHAQALKGINSQMWASYLAMFQQPHSGEPSPKCAKAEIDNVTMPDLQTVKAEEFPIGIGTMGGDMQPLFAIPTSVGNGGGGWLGLS